MLLHFNLTLLYFLLHLYSISIYFEALEVVKQYLLFLKEKNNRMKITFNKNRRNSSVCEIRLRRKVCCKLLCVYFVSDCFQVLTRTLLKEDESTFKQYLLFFNNLILLKPRVIRFSSFITTKIRLSCNILLRVEYKN